MADAEMHRVFNCGIGMVVIVAEADAGSAMQLLAAAGGSLLLGHIAARGMDGADRRR